MSDRPIIFSASMVQALLAGRKTQTRRILQPQPERVRGEDGVLLPVTLHYTLGKLLPRVAIGRFIPIRAPVYHYPGQRLWVRESVRAEELEDGRDGVRYHADQAWRPIENSQAAADAWIELRGDPLDGVHGPPPRIGVQRTAIHMPRWASRITLTVTELRIEALQELSEADAAAEGIVPTYRDGKPIPHDGTGRICREAFRSVWNRIHGRKSAHCWAANPWVLVIGFTTSVSEPPA